MVQSCLHFGWRFNVHFPPYVGFYIEMCAPPNKNKLLKQYFAFLEMGIGI